MNCFPPPIIKTIQRLDKAKKHVHPAGRDMKLLLDIYAPITQEHLLSGPYAAWFSIERYEITPHKSKNTKSFKAKIDKTVEF
jgi:hypothetical protein